MKSIQMIVYSYFLMYGKVLNNNEYKITSAVLNGHKASDGDEFQLVREKIKKYRIELKIL